MYCSTTGTFLQRDPMGSPGEAIVGYSHSSVARIMRSRNRTPSFGRRDDSSNLYEYVNSNPLNYVDPTGKQIYVDDGSGYPPWYVEIPLPPVNGITPIVQVDSNCQNYVAVRNAVTTVCKNLQKAKQILEKRGADLCSYYSKRKGAVATGLGTPQGQAQLIKQIDKALEACNGKKPFKIFCPSSGEKGTDAYVNFLAYTNIVTGVGINLNPSWFDNGGDWTRVLHEMGRFYNSMGEDFTETANDVYLWDNKMQFLTGNAEEELDLFKENNP